MEYLQTKRLLKTNTRLFMLNRLPLILYNLHINVNAIGGLKNKDISGQTISNKNICVYLQRVARHNTTMPYRTTV